MTQPHSERAHSKFSASGAERWGNCPGSVGLSEGLPDKDSVWSIEGTRAHEVLEGYLRIALGLPVEDFSVFDRHPYNEEMNTHAANAVDFILKIAGGAEVLCEHKVYLDWLNPEAFGTLDAAIVDYFGTLHIIDYKYGAGVAVSPRENLQMIFYALAVTHLHHWNFKSVRIWIIQPRIKSYDGPVFWDVSMKAMRAWETVFRDMIRQVEIAPNLFYEGPHCHWCRAKSICPLKTEKQVAKLKDVFEGVPW